MAKRAKAFGWGGEPLRSLYTRPQTGVWVITGMERSPRRAAAPTMRSMAIQSVGTPPSSRYRLLWPAGTWAKVGYGWATPHLATKRTDSTPFRDIAAVSPPSLNSALFSGPSIMVPKNPLGTERLASAGPAKPASAATRTKTNRTRLTWCLYRKPARRFGISTAP